MRSPIYYVGLKEIDDEREDEFLRGGIMRVLIAALFLVSFSAFADFTDPHNPIEQYNLGLMYATGLEVPQSATMAVKWFHKAADQGLVQAQYVMGLAYDDGQGVSQNYVEAVKWYRKASDQGYPDAQSNLGAMYLEGHGVSKNVIEAAKWCLLSDDAGDPTGKKCARYIGAHGLLTPAQVKQVESLILAWSKTHHELVWGKHMGGFIQ